MLQTYNIIFKKTNFLVFLTKHILYLHFKSEKTISTFWNTAKIWNIKLLKKKTNE